MKKIILFSILQFFYTSLFATNYYWVGNGGNFNNLSHWATSSGGSTLHTELPGADDDVYFDSNSFTTANQTVTVYAAIEVKSMFWTGVTNNPTFREGSSYEHKFHGSLFFSPNMTEYFGARIKFVGNAPFRYLDQAGLQGFGFLEMDMEGTLFLFDSLYADVILITDGNLNTSNYNITLKNGPNPSYPDYADFRIFGSQNTVTLGSSTVRCGNFGLNGGNSLNAGTSTIITSALRVYDAITFNDVVLEGYRNVQFRTDGNANTALTFNNLTVNLASFKLNAEMTVNGDFTVSSVGAEITLGGIGGTAYTFNGGLTIPSDCNNYFTLNSYYLIKITNNNLATTLPFGRFTGVNISNYDITSDQSIDLGGNSGILFNNLRTPRDFYWVGGVSTSFGDVGNWSLTSGGPQTSCGPLEIDNLRFDANSFNNGSNFSAGGRTYHDITWDYTADEPTLSVSGSYSPFILTGSLSLPSDISVNGYYGLQFSPEGNETLTTNNAHINTEIIIFGPGTLSLGSDLIISDNINHRQGTLSLNGKTLEVEEYAATNTTKSKLLDISNSTMSADLWEAENTNFSLSASNSQLEVSDIELTGSSTPQLSFHHIKPKNTQLLVDINGHYAQKITLNGGSSNFYGNATMDSLVSSSNTNRELLRLSDTLFINNYIGLASTCSNPSRFDASYPDGFISSPANLFADEMQLNSYIHFIGSGSFTVNNPILPYFSFPQPTGFTFTYSSPNDLYWVGEDGEWDDPSNWSEVSGGDGSCYLPDENINVHFDENSFTDPSDRVTIDAPAQAYTMTWNNALPGAGIDDATATNTSLSIYRDLNLENGMSFEFADSLIFPRSGGVSYIHSDSVALPADVYVMNGAMAIITEIFTSKSLELIDGRLISNPGAYIISTNLIAKQGNNSLDFNNMYFDGNIDIDFNSVINFEQVFQFTRSSIFKLSGTQPTGLLFDGLIIGNTLDNLENGELINNTNSPLNIIDLYLDASELTAIKGDINLNRFGIWNSGMTLELEAGKTYNVNSPDSFIDYSPDNCTFIKSDTDGIAANFIITSGGSFNQVVLKDINSTGSGALSNTNGKLYSNVTGWNLLGTPSSCGPEELLLLPKVVLQGPFDEATGLMRSTLNNNNLLPLNEPYTALGLHNGTEQTTADILDNNNIVDWVLLELRDENDPSIVHATKAGLLANDGSILTENGSSLIKITGLDLENYYVAIRHKNHLGVMTSFPIPLSAAAHTSLDFTTVSLFGTNASTNLSGLQVLWMGDATSSGQVDAADRSKVWNDRNQTVYASSDCNLDGVCDAQDRSITWNNRNKTEQIP